jgi:NAD(P)-dependent dehydrogenase (short-subunit alcohol dehydrogenase family)
MDFGLKGKTAVVSGSTAGIGQAIASTLRSSASSRSVYPGGLASSGEKCAKRTGPSAQQLVLFW